MPKPPKYALFKSKKERVEHLQEAWRIQREIMLDPEAPHGVRLDASDKRIDRIIGKAPQRIEVTEETPIDRQLFAQVRKSPEGRQVVRELVQRMREIARPAIDVTPDLENNMKQHENSIGKPPGTSGKNQCLLRKQEKN